MRNRLPVFPLFAGLSALLPVLAAGQETTPAPYVEGDRVVPFTLEDQHGEAGSVDDRVRLVLFAADMDGGRLVRDALEGDASLHDLEALDAVFVSDIQRMPALITRLFALPSMRRRPYRMLLEREPGPTARLPRQEGKVTVVRLEALAIQSIEFVGDAPSVAGALRGEDGASP